MTRPDEGFAYVRAEHPAAEMLIEAVGILRDLVEADPVAWCPGDYMSCFGCDLRGLSRDHYHTEDCPWLRASRLLGIDPWKDQK